VAIKSYRGRMSRARYGIAVLILAPLTHSQAGRQQQQRKDTHVCTLEGMDSRVDGGGSPQRDRDGDDAAALHDEEQTTHDASAASWAASLEDDSSGSSSSSSSSCSSENEQEDIQAPTYEFDDMDTNARIDSRRAARRAGTTPASAPAGALLCLVTYRALAAHHCELLNTVLMQVAHEMALEMPDNEELRSTPAAMRWFCDGFTIDGPGRTTMQQPSSDASWASMAAAAAAVPM